jgi:hypothetical protein
LVVLLPTDKALDILNQNHKKLLKQIISLVVNVADQAIYIFSGMIPIEAEIHLKALTLFGNITRAEKPHSRMAYSREAASHKN